MTASKPVQKSSRWRLRLGERRTLLLVGDLLMALLALALGLWFWMSADVYRLPFSEFLRQRPQGWFFVLPLVWLILLVETYDTHRSTHWKHTAKNIALAALIGFGAYAVVYFTSEPNSLPRRGVAVFLLAASLLTLLWRSIYIRVFTTPAFMRRVLLVGAGVTGQALLRVIRDLQPPPFFLVGLVDDDPAKVDLEMQNYKVFGGSEHLLNLIAEQDVSDVIVAISGKMNPRMFRVLLDAQERGIEITRFPAAYEQLLGRVPVQYLEADWILRSFVDEARVSSFYEAIKRLLDIFGGLVGVLILALIGPFIALAVFIESGRPIVFTQTRAGRGGRPYTVIKFRTMVKDAEKEGTPQFATENDARTTAFGRFLRKSHLDEWPQFINVLRGEMSLVGPRPERPELMEKYQEQIPFYRGRLLDKPGITGWAQINFGYAADIEEMGIKLEYDLYYIKHRSVMLDLVIILRTIGTVFGFRGR